MTGEGDTRLASVLADYHAVDATEAVDVARLRAAIETSDVYARSSPLHVTGSAIVVHPATGRALLRWHPRMAMWIHVGGHFDPDERDPLAVARREAREETGLTDLRPLTEVPIQIAIVPVPAFGDDPAHEHADFRYVLTTETPDAIVAENDTARLRWLTFAEARREVPEDQLRELLNRAERLL